MAAVFRISDHISVVINERAGGVEFSSFQGAADSWSLESLRQLSITVRLTHSRGSDIHTP